jgi:hypothetical protein
MPATIGVYCEDEDGAFENTPLSGSLRSVILDSIRGSAIQRPDSLSLLVWHDLYETVRSGEQAFSRVFGKGVFVSGGLASAEAR